MDVEVHYYIAFLLAAKAGFGLDYTLKIAYSNQYVDDNDHIPRILGRSVKKYKYSITQIPKNLQILTLTSNKTLDAILPVFHFVPGDLQDAELKHDLIVTKRNSRVTASLRFALVMNNPYLIGIASHAFLDSWAHQNFTGTFDRINALYLNDFIISIGHSDAFFDPDAVGVIWFDPRLRESKRDNAVIFAEAIKELLAEYTLQLLHRHLDSDDMAFLSNLNVVLSYRNLNTKKRIALYDRISRKYLGLSIVPYHKYMWANSAVSIKTVGPRKSTALSLWNEGDLCSFYEAVNIFKNFILHTEGVERLLN